MQDDAVHDHLVARPEAQDVVEHNLLDGVIADSAGAQDVRSGGCQ
jgi:hypothetical protein